MKLKEIKNEKALGMIADLIEPIGKIGSNKELVQMLKEKKIKEAIPKVLKENPHEIIEILAILDETPVEEYECNILTLPARLIELFNDEEVLQLFS